MCVVLAGVAGGVHAEQHFGDCGGVGAAGPQVRPHVHQACLRPLVRRRGHGGGRVLRGQARHEHALAVNPPPPPTHTQETLDT